MINKDKKIIKLDCTLRDGGYYNNWDFEPKLIEDYLAAMVAAKIDVVELGFRFIENNGFKGPCAFSKDNFLKSIQIPKKLKVSIMINASDILSEIGMIESLKKLFPKSSKNSPVDIVRIACHFHEVKQILPATKWLSDNGYIVGVNLMQISERSKKEIEEFCIIAKKFPISVLYFADSLGSINDTDIIKITQCFKKFWNGPIGIHTHDNMGLALKNTVCALKNGVTWLDSTVSGMGRGPGNARTEELVIELKKDTSEIINIVPLIDLIDNYFKPLKIKYEWGTNPFYFLSGKFGIHPTYVQEMLQDTSYSNEDILAVLYYLHKNDGKKFQNKILVTAKNFFSEEPKGSWEPKKLLNKKDVLIIGSGPSVSKNKDAIERFISNFNPIVIGLNAQDIINSNLINLRVASHPVRILSDYQMHLKYKQPLVLPFSMLSNEIKKIYSKKNILDFGAAIVPKEFQFYKSHCILPNSLVLGYALAIIESGHANNIFMAGFDGYSYGDPRNDAIENLMNLYFENIKDKTKKIIMITPTKLKNLILQSVHGI